MSRLRGEVEAGERLKQTALRDCSSEPIDDDDPRWRLGTYKLAFTRDEAPVPALLRYALTLIGCEAYGPGEKVAWWVNFTFREELCSLAHEKFGLRLYLRTDRSEEDARQTLGQIARKLQSAVRIVEQVILDAAPDLLGKGHASVRNQHHSLRRAYEYFQERAERPIDVKDRHETGKAEYVTWSTFKYGKIEMQLNSFHDMVAAISAYMSLLEHDLVLALAFSGFDPNEDDLTKVIGARWGEKWDRVIGQEGDGGLFRKRLYDVVERWRNPYSHGGFEKGHRATIWLHTSRVGAAVPVGLTRVRESPLFSFMPAGETDVADVFALFNEIDVWLAQRLPEATEWTNSGLNVRYDDSFRSMLAEARKRDDFNGFLRYHEHQQMMFENMDY